MERQGSYTIFAAPFVASSSGNMHSDSGLCSRLFSPIACVRQHVVRRIVAGKFAFKGRRWRQVTEEARVFVVQLLQVDPKKRPTGEQGLKLSWLHTEDFWGSTRNMDTEAVMDNVQATLETFASYGRLKKLALLVIAYKSTSDEIGYLRKVRRNLSCFNPGTSFSIFTATSVCVGVVNHSHDIFSLSFRPFSDVSQVWHDIRWGHLIGGF